MYLYNFHPYIKDLKWKGNLPISFTFLNNGVLTFSYRCPDQLQLVLDYWPKGSWISWNLEKPNLLENNSGNTKNNMKSQIKNRKNSSFDLRNY